jgi:hypothetical protein
MKSDRPECGQALRIFGVENNLELLVHLYVPSSATRQLSRRMGQPTNSR